jgi:hypothetical protein
MYDFAPDPSAFAYIEENFLSFFISEVTTIEYRRVIKYRRAMAQLLYMNVQCIYCCIIVTALLKSELSPRNFSHYTVATYSGLVVH